MIEIGDEVYYRYRVGHFYKTRSGVVTEINDGVATLKLTNQNTYGGTERVNINILIKKNK